MDHDGYAAELLGSSGRFLNRPRTFRSALWRWVAPQREVTQSFETRFQVGFESPRTAFQSDQKISVCSGHTNMPMHDAGTRPGPPDSGSRGKARGPATEDPAGFANTKLQEAVALLLKASSLDSDRRVGVRCSPLDTVRLA